jgi:actinorhodin biosynthesis protein ActVIA
MRHRSVAAALFAVFVAGFAAFVQAQSSGARSTALSTQDYIDIQQLYARYALLIDTGDAEGWANTFTPDGVFNNSSRGHDALVQFVHDWRDNRRGASLRHWNSNLVITPTADGASGSIYMQLLDISTTQPTATASYRYEDTLVKTAAGWRFKTRVLHRDAAPATR